MKVDLSCPIELWEYKLPSAESPALSFTFFNMGQKTISSIQITVTCFDANDEVITRRVERPMALEAVGRETFVVELPSEGDEMDAVDLSIDKVWYEDGSEWRRQQDIRLLDYEPNELPPNRQLEHLKFVAGEDAVGFPSEQGAVWVCICGRVNGIDEPNCRRCDRDKEDVFDRFSVDSVEQQISLREIELEDKARHAREEASRQEFIRQDKAKRKKRARRTRTIIISTTLVLGVLAYLFIVLGLPELKYQTAMSAMASSDLHTARTGFEELLDYRDAPEMIKECDLRLAAEYAASGDMDRVDEAIALLRTLGAYPGTAEALQNATYQKGLLYLDSGAYEDASAVFASLPKDYRDADDQRKRADYELAKQAMDAKDYEDAAARFLALGDYSDAQDLAKECVYVPAMTLANEGEYAKAVELFTQVIDYKDAAEQRLATIYKDALQAQNAGDLDYATARFEMLGNYGDAPEQMQHSIYLMANEARNSGNYDRAVRLYTSIRNYRDSADLIKASVYQPAKALLDEKRYAEAAEMFATILDYEEAEELYNQSLYLPAKEAMDAGEYDEAIALFEQVPEYSDVAKLLPQAQYRRAEALETEGDLAGAIEAFDALDDYSDAAERANKARYALAEEAFAAGQFQRASERFEALGRYADAPTRVKECAYELAMLLFNAGEYETAYDAFAAITDYAPARSKAQESAYMQGEALQAADDLAAAADMFALAGRYEDAETRYRESIYMQATDLMEKRDYQAAGELFNSVTGYSDARAKRDEAYDLWLSEKNDVAKAAYDDGDYQTVIDTLRELDIEDLPKAYTSMQTMYYDANMKIARQLIGDNRSLDAYTYLVAANGYKDANTLLDKNIYRILGTWETEDGIRYAFYLNGTANIAGETYYFNMFNPYGVSVGETNEQSAMKRILSYVDGGEKSMKLREDETQKMIILTRVRAPEVSPVRDGEGGIVLDDLDKDLSEPVVDVIGEGDGEPETPEDEAPEEETPKGEG